MAFEDQLALALEAECDDDRRYFTVDEANRALVYLRGVVADLQAEYRQIVGLRRRIERGGGQTADAERAYEGAMDRLSDLVDEVHAVGVELKDFERGMIDFPSWREGREVLLCWQAGEDAVTHWHEIDGGVSDRRPMAA
ncbi:MAG: DUF2203 domain-containing protein [Planctomycetota bacterium]